MTLRDATPALHTLPPGPDFLDRAAVFVLAVFAWGLLSTLAKKLIEVAGLRPVDRTLGALFSYAPNSAEIAPLVAAFQDGSWQQQWPFPVAAPLASGFAASAEETLPEAWQRLFIGPWALPAPPWGSVWLDKESVLFGDSTLALRQWMRENGIALEADGNEPEDHFGTVLLLAAWLCETEQDALFAQLLAWHLLPWSGRFLSVFVDHAAHPFYQALGQLAQATLAQWQENLPIAVAEKALYR